MGTRFHTHACPSTNDLAKQAAKAGLVRDRDYFTAETMTAGRATNGNTWHAPAGGLWLSIIIHNPPTPTHLWPAIAAANAIEVAFNIHTQLKWPNDVLTEKTSRKIAGILVERVETPHHTATIIGIGINVAQPSFPPALAATATSIAIEAPGATPSPNALLPILLDQLGAAEHLDLVAEFERRAPMTRAPITIYRAGRPPAPATAEGLTRAGALRVRYNDNTTETLTSAADLDIRPGVMPPAQATPDHAQPSPSNHSG